METSTSVAYMIVARYNRSKWNRLNQEEKEAAHHAAEFLFPEAEPEAAQHGAESFSQEAPKVELVAGLRGKGKSLRIAQSFTSDIFDRLASSEYGALSKAEKNLFVDGIYATFPPTPPVGWLEIVPAEGLLAFIDKMNRPDQMKRNGSALWKVYDIEIHSLNADWSETTIHDLIGGPILRGDENTDQVYTFMTPRNWS